MTGGAARSSLWPQLIAEICDVEVEVLEFDELTAFGAANIAYKAVFGQDNSLQLPQSVVRKRYKPQIAEYRDWYNTVNDRFSAKKNNIHE